MMHTYRNESFNFNVPSVLNARQIPFLLDDETRFFYPFGWCRRHPPCGVNRPSNMRGITSARSVQTSLPVPRDCIHTVHHCDMLGFGLERPRARVDSVCAPRRVSRLARAQRIETSLDLALWQLTTKRKLNDTQSCFFLKRHGNSLSIVAIPLFSEMLSTSIGTIVM